METTETPDESVWSAGELHGLADVIAGLAPAEQRPDLLSQLDALERLKSAAAAAQVAITTAFADAADAEEVVPRPGRRVPPRAMSIGAEVALAVRTSPYGGEQRVLLSRRLREDLPQTLAALAQGALSEDRAFAVAREVAHLDASQRGAVDRDLAERAGSLAGGLADLGDQRLRQAVRRSCLTHAAEAEDRRYRRARDDRHVTSRQLDDGTGRLTAILKLEDLAKVRAALDESCASARSAGDDRTGGQVRADTLVARVTGQDPASPTAVRVDVVIGVESLLGDGTEPGYVQGVGFLPAGLCTDLVRRASDAAKAVLRRLFVSPGERALVAMESTSRAFDGLLREFLDLRDGGTCRTPGCNARIRHLDHVQAVADHGATVGRNAQGLCERCNYVKETPGWVYWVPDRAADERHQVHGVTEHLRIVRSTAPPMPGGPGGTIDYSPAELMVARRLALAG